MAEWNGLPGLGQPRAFIEPMQQVDVGGAYEATGKAIGQVAGQIRKVLQPIMNDVSAEQGARSVTRDENGVLQVTTRYEFEEQDAVYNNAAEAAYLSQLGLDFRDRFMELREQPNLQLDPQAFRIAAEGLLEGTLETAPGAFRGAAASLFNQELARNMSDIADKKERAMFARQKSAIDANIAMAENDVFALANSGGLDTPEGVQAVQTLVSAVRVQENPIWGVSDEEIQLQIESKLSLAKAYGSRGAIMGVYRSKGFEAAAAATKQLLSSPDLMLTPAQRGALENDIMSEISTMESAASRRRSEAAAALGAQRAWAGAELGIRIADYAVNGGGDPKVLEDLFAQVRTAASSGVLSPSDYESLTIKLVNTGKEAAAAAQVDAALVAEGQRLMAVGFDPTNGDQMKALDRIFVGGTAEMTPEQRWGAAVQVARDKGAIPPSEVERLKPGLYAAGSPDRQVETALQVATLYNANKGATEKAFTAAEVERAMAIKEAVSTGYPNIKAVQMVDDLQKASPEDLQQRKTEVSDAFNVGTKNGEKPGPERQYVMDTIGSWGVDVETLAATDPNKIEQVVTDYKAAYDRSYQLTRSQSAARATADREVRSMWGPSLWGRPTGETSIWSFDPRDGTQFEVYKPTGVSLGVHAPDVVYSGGLPPDQAFAYQALELTGLMLAGGYKAEDYGLKSWGEVGKLQPRFAGTAGPGGSIVYYLEGPDGRFVTAPDGSRFVWQPDVTAPKAMYETTRAAAEEAARKADETATGFPLGGDED